MEPLLLLVELDDPFAALLAKLEYLSKSIIVLNSVNN